MSSLVFDINSDCVLPWRHQLTTGESTPIILLALNKKQQYFLYIYNICIYRWISRSMLNNILHGILVHAIMLFFSLKIIWVIIFIIYICVHFISLLQCKVKSDAQKIWWKLISCAAVLKLKFICSSLKITQVSN